MRPVLPPDPAGLRAWRDATLYRLVTRASEAEMRETLSRLRQRGYQDVTNTDTALLANLDTADTTISALARRSGVTRQAASQQLALLSQKGYVSREPDPADSRAILVRRTAKGQALMRDALEIVAEIEAEYAGILGAGRLAVLKELLTDLVGRADPGGTLGGDLPVATRPSAGMRSSAGPAGTSAAACSRPAGRRRPG
jgi:DNA-binding MarR family transcriptional regulator